MLLTLCSNRKNLVENFFKSYSNQCGQCGRRFIGTPEGKKLKMEHLDWHFKVNSRVANQSGGIIVHRSAYLDEIVSFILQLDTTNSHSNGQT
jgi:pre-mRNA cleavage complex 2 protein Pcf11